MSDIDATKPYFPKNAGDLMLAAEWNDLQIKIKKDILDVKEYLTEEIEKQKKINEQLKKELGDSKKLTEDIGKRLPKGSIIMWSGDTLPEGWVLCDGSNSTPDLTNKFVLGANLIHNIGTKSDGDKLSIDINNQTNLAGSHSHKQTLPSRWRAQNYQDGRFTSIDIDNDMKLFSETSTSTDGEHKHDILIKFLSDKVLMPPYYVLAFIMKT
ncbi:tail fiber protein [Thiolinea disciformis]|uniref:tail fiber protein n=1 Tax=Thiolinea disciformis TaxID=125614 RepID=UPI00036FAC32|nr:tail fiber protein [Thiolinea disciformis]